MLGALGSVQAMVRERSDTVAWTLGAAKEALVFLG